MSGHLTNLASMVNRKPRAEPEPEPVPVSSQAPMQVVAPSPALRVRPTGKRSSFEHERIAVYVRKDTRKKAERKWEDEGHRDLSNLIEKLLSEYAGS